MKATNDVSVKFGGALSPHAHTHTKFVLSFGTDGLTLPHLLSVSLQTIENS